MAKRKTVTFQITVSAPAGTPKRAIAREVRTLVNQQCFYDGRFDEGDIKLRKIKGVGR